MFCDNQIQAARKSLILNGEMSEWSIEHAWKALRWNSVETYRITFFAVVSTTSLLGGLSPCLPVSDGVCRG